MLKFAGETSEGETTDGWEEEDEAEPKVPYCCFNVKLFISIM